jgi:branched-chain amino acid transport system permease protein
MSYLRRHGVFLSFAVVMMAAPFFITNKYYLSVLAFTATRLMIVLGLNLLMGQAGQISLGHAAFVGLGAYGSAILTTRYQIDPWVAMVAAAVLAGSVAALIGVPTLKLKGHYLAMATLGFGEIVHILLIQFKWLTRGTDGIVGIPPLMLGDINLSQPFNFHLLAWGIALIMLRISLNLTGSRVGRSLRALHRADIAAQSLGVNTAFRKVQIFVVSAVFASLSGSLYVHYVYYISPDSFTIVFSVILVTTVIIGGMGSVWGAVVGTFVMMLLPEYLKRYDQDYTNLVFGLMLILIMIFLPGGLIGIAQLKGRILRRFSRRPRANGFAEPDIAVENERTVEGV